MQRSMLCAVGAGSLLVIGSSLFVHAAPPGSGFDAGETPGAAPTPGEAESTVESFLDRYPGVALSERGGRITRVYGRAFSEGQTPHESVAAFLDQAAVLGAEPEDLVPGGPAIDGVHEMGLMYDPDTGNYRFTVFFFAQQRDGVPVFGSALRLLVRNEAGFPLVLASADVHDLGDFQVDPAALLQPADTQSALGHAQLLTFAEGPAEVVSTRKVIYADEHTAPTLADETLVGVDIDRWLVVTDAESGDVLFEEQRIYTIDVVGTTEGVATGGVGTDECEPETTVPMPYLTVTAGGNSAVSDVDGNFTIPNPGSEAIDVVGTLDGQWFDVVDFAGADIVLTSTVTPPGPATLTFNATNASELVRAQVNAYLYSNLIRDFVLQYVPNYPGVETFENFTINTNRDDGVCPQNAWYSPGDPSINFCRSPGIGIPNTAWSSVIIHEYGHHLVQMSGSGQCEYGEGNSDVMSVLFLDDPRIGVGFFGSCSGALRNADNACQYEPSSCSSCGGPCHSCGQLISGAVWSTRNNLVVTEPDSYTDILSTLVLNSFFVHTGTSITPDIAIDYLTLDDDDSDLGNGTPHFDEIATGFADHGLFEISVEFTFPNGLPTLISPAGGTTVQVEVADGSAAPQPDTGRLFVDAGGGFLEIPMTELAPNSYEAVFPGAACGQTVRYYFAVDTTTGTMLTEPSNAPATAFTAVPGSGINVIFTDDGESDNGWTVSGSADDGQWDRGTPIPNSTCDRGNPDTDGDGSGQCWLTDNSSANNCNSDVDTGTTILTSPVIDAGQGDPLVRYWRWYDNTAGSAPNTDIFTVQLSNDGGASWANLEVVGPVTQAGGGWYQVQYRISDLIPPSSQFRVRFSASDTDPQSVVEAAVDGLEILTVDCDDAGIPGDLDLDGDVDTVDFLALLAAWGPCPAPCPPSCLADLSGDCTVDTVDFLELLAAWTG